MYSDNTVSFTEINPALLFYKNTLDAFLWERQTYSPFKDVLFPWIEDLYRVHGDYFSFDYHGNSILTSVQPDYSMEELSISFAKKELVSVTVLTGTLSDETHEATTRYTDKQVFNKDLMQYLPRFLKRMTDEKNTASANQFRMKAVVNEYIPAILHHLIEVNEHLSSWQVRATWLNPTVVEFSTLRIYLTLEIASGNLTQVIFKIVLPEFD